MSDQDIASGSIWLNEVFTELHRSRVGIICVTRENALAPWLHFEAGALLKSMSVTRVTPYLVDLEFSEVKGALTAFQGKRANKEQTKALLDSIRLDTRYPTSMTDLVFDRTFEKWWPDLELRLSQFPNVTAPPVQPKLGDMAAETLQIAKELAREMGRISGAVELLSSSPALFSSSSSPYAGSGYYDESGSDSGSGFGSDFRSVATGANVRAFDDYVDFIFNKDPRIEFLLKTRANLRNILDLIGDWADEQAAEQIQNISGLPVSEAKEFSDQLYRELYAIAEWTNGPSEYSNKDRPLP